MFGHVASAQKRTLKKSLEATSKDPNMDMLTYISRLRQSWLQLKDAGVATVTETDMCTYLLDGLPKEYATLRSILYESDKELTLNLISPKLLEAEERYGEFPTSQYTALAAAKVCSGDTLADSFNDESTCYYCGEPGHIQSKCLKKAYDDGYAHGRNDGYNDGRAACADDNGWATQ
jgi:hypothetical protein